MKEQRGMRWRLEANNPDQVLWGWGDDSRTRWKVVREFDHNELTAYQELIEELNQINAPVVLRVVPASD